MPSYRKCTIGHIDALPIYGGQPVFIKMVSHFLPNYLSLVVEETELNYDRPQPHPRPGAHHTPT